MNLRLPHESPRRRALSLFTSQPGRRNSGKRRRDFERLERRDLLAAAVWNNVAWPVDVSGNNPGFVSPIDALLVVNEINSREYSEASGRLPKQVSGTASLPFFDVTCDGFVAPLDALLVINHINSIGSGSGGNPSTLGGVFPSASCSPQLVEGNDFVSQWSKPLVVPDSVSSLEVLLESPTFDTTSQGTIRDAFEIEVFDQSGFSVLPPYQFNHESLLNWTEGYDARVAPGVRMEPGSAGLMSVIIDVSNVPVGTALTVQTRLVNNDLDDQSSVVVRGVQFTARTSDPITSNVASSQIRNGSVAPVDLRQLTDVTSSLQVSYGQTTLSLDNEKLIASASVTNQGSIVIRDRLIAVVDRFSSLDTDLFQPDGRLADGRAFLDLSDWLPGNGLDGQAGSLSYDQSTLPREIQFLHRGQERFLYGVKFYALTNTAPSAFTSSSITEIGVGSTYQYGAQAIDPEGDELRYSLIAAPTSASINAATGAIVWKPIESDVGSTRWIVRATDPFGLYAEQTFDVTVVESLQNRPPNFTTTPVLEATASSGFEIATVPVGSQPVAAAVLNGLQGNRLVIANAGDQHMGVYEPLRADEYAEEFTVSTGEPKPNDLVLRSGIEVDIGLPPFLQANDNNAVLSLDQGDFNGDGILDLATLTYRFESWIDNAPTSRRTIEITVVLGDGDGGFSSPTVVYQSVNQANEFKYLQAGDVNGDSLVDLVAIEEASASLIVILGNGTGSFAAATTTSMSLGINDYRLVDLDQDGNTDIVGKSWDWSRFGWMKGRGDGTFESFVNIYGSVPNAGDHLGIRPYRFVDLNKDGFLDIVLSKYGENVTVLLLNDGHQNFTVANSFSGINALFLYVADFTGDGNVDILYTRPHDGFPSLLVGDSTGLQYSYKGINTPVGTWSGNRAGKDDPVDIDRDGDLDVIFASGRDGTSGTDVTQVLVNDGQGNFSMTAYTLQRNDGRHSDLQPMRAGAVHGVVAGDYNGDGRLDFATMFNSPNFNGVSVALGTRPGEFMANPTTPMDNLSVFYNYVYAEDFNRDGFQDLLSMPARAVRLGRGDGTFSDPFPATNVGGGDGGVLIEDFNRDGIADLLYSRTYQYVAALGNGDGTFEVTQRGNHSGFYQPSTLQAGDFNNDGYPDFIAKFPVESFIDVMLNDPLNPGTFTRSQQLYMEGVGGLARGYGGAVTVGDFDSDGTLDMVVADARPGEWKRLITYSGLGDGTFVVSHEQADFRDGSFPNWVKSGDLNEDGNLDVLTLTGAGIVVHLGNGDGSFLVPTYLPDNGCFGGVFCHADYDWGHVVDIDSDGHLDLVTTTNATSNLAIRLGQGDGTFAAPTSWQTHFNPVVPDFADLDNDGHLDIVHWKEGGGGAASIYYGVRDGLVDMISADINRDGNMDVLAVNAANDRLKLFVGNNVGELQRMPDLQTGRAPSAVAVADLDRDQALEIITANRSGRSISVFTGSLTTQYVPIEYPVGKSPIDVATGDFNRDQHPDVFVLDAEKAVWMMAGSADGLLSTPVAIALGDTPGKLAAQDATGDGLVDLVITLPNSNRLMILPGNGTGFGNPQYLSLSSSPADVAVLDLNGDRRPDLVTSLTDSDQLSIFYSRGGGQYASAQLVSVGDQPSTLTVSDLDSDGKQDIIVTNRGDDTASIIYNRFDPNEIYRYDADAFDPDGDALTYRVVEGPGGLFVDSQSGQVFWAASPDQIGLHRVVLEASDNRGGITTQSFQIDVQPSRENASPLITTTPPTIIGAAETFRYQLAASDLDRETLRYRLLQGPDGASIDATTGLVTWDGTNSRAIQLNPYNSAGYIEVPDSPTLKPASLTIEGWYKFHSTTLSGGVQVLYEIDGIGNPGAYGLYTTQAGKLVFDMNPSTSAGLVRVEADFVPTLNQWYHFGVTFDDESGVLKLYVNGAQVASGLTDNSIIYGPGSLYLGTAGPALPHVTMDNFRVWNTARTASQIAEGLSRQYEGHSNLILDFRFEDQTTISVHDHSSANNFGFRRGELPPILVDGLADLGTHSFLIGVEDGRGGFDTQSFELEIVPELRGSIAGQLFEDTNRDGTKSADEVGLAGWVSYLDFNANSFPDPGEPTATTDATGKYLFSKLLPGSYPVRVVTVAGHSSVEPTNVSVASDRVSTVNRAIELLTLGQIRGSLKTEVNQPIANWQVFADLDLDGLFDESEPVATTDAQGNYAIAGLSAGDYTVRPGLLPGWSNVAGNVGLSVTLGPSMISASNNFTLRPTNTSVTGAVHFVTTPSTTTEARQVYRYAALALNLNKTSIAYDLSLAPEGMTIDPTTGLVAWRPTIDQVGEHSVILRATDTSGSVALHDFVIEVTSPNTVSVLIANPPLMAYVDTAYVHDFAAQDAEASSLVFSIASGPAGATIDQSSGRLRWVPKASDVGQVSLTIEVRDASNNAATRTFAIDVTSSVPNALPLSIQLPRNSAAVGKEYLSQIRATDALQRPTTWSLVTGPSGLTVSSTGLLRWTPTSGDLGVKSVQLLATTADGVNQAVDFAIEVLGSLTNSNPQITSQPKSSAIVGREYRYQVQVADADRDSLSFSLLSAPAGMSIHPDLGIIAWNPALDQLGSANVSVQVADAMGATAVQSYSLRVGRTGGPPMITSVPGSEAYVGQGYLHTILASEAVGNTLVYRLLAAPVGTQISSATGEISWTPTLDQLGQQLVAIEVSDGAGGATSQSFAVRVRDGVPNQPPRIESLAPRFGAVGTLYTFTMQALDPEGATLTYSLGRAPAGMSIDASTGLVQWTPAPGQAGKSIVTLLATDAGGASAIESFELDVLAENRKPQINSTAPLEVPARGEFRYDVSARDADLDLLQYRLLLAPAGASIDAFGTIRWRTRPEDIGAHDFQVSVSDPRGGEATQSFRLNVIADVVPPKVSLIYGPDNGNVFPWDGPMTLYAKAIDNVEVASLTVTVNGQEIRLDAFGQAAFSFEQWGFTRLNAVAKATDTNGNVTEKSVTFGFAFPEGWDGGGVVIPTVAISGPTEAATVFGMVTITGTASHPDLESYKLSYRRIDQTEFTQFFESTTPVVNGQLGVWDTSLLINDEYVIRLEASSRAGIVNVMEQNVGLSGELKLGNFRLSFTDMVIPVAGIPIQITRIYDTLQADRQGEFGYGWRLEYRDTDLRVGVPKSGLEDIGVYSPLRPGVKVYLNVPGVGRQGFTFEPIIRVLPGFGGNNLVLAQPRFTPDPGVTSTLDTGTSGYLQVNEFGELFAPGGIPYNPASPDFGGAYVLTTRDGITYRVDGTSGRLTSASDRSGNRLTFDENGISNNGRQVLTTQRDQFQRIVRILGPDNASISYDYNGRNLVRYSDQEGFITTYKYDARNRLQEVIDPLGRPYARTTYGPDGRLLSVTDANGRTINFTHSGDTNQQIIEDANGSLTVLEYDSRGQIVRETNALGGVIQREFDSVGRVLVEVNANGGRVVNRYDAQGNLISQVDRNGNIVRFTYDSQNLPTSLTTAGGQTTHFRYNAAGLLTARISDTGETLESIEYDSRGNPIRTTNAAGQTETLEYDESGNARAMEDALGRRIELTVNASGLSTGQIDARGTSLEFERDTRGLVTAIRGTDGKSVQRRFNAAGQLIGMTTPSGGQTQFAVDALGNETLLQDANGGTQLRTYNLTGDLISLTNENGSITRYEYDLLGRRTKTIHPDGSSETFQYDAVGNLTVSSDGLGNVMRFEYDLERQLVLVRDALSRETRYEYDAEGRTTRIVATDGSTVEYAYDAQGNRVRTKLPDGKVLKHEYDRAGKLVAEIDPSGRATRYVYDAAGQLTSVSAPGSGVSHYAYDANGNLIRQEDPLGNVTAFEYDTYNRLVVKTYPGGDREQYSYDAEGWQTSRKTADGETTIVYDRNGNVLSQRFADGKQESFTYSATNRVLSATNVFGTIVMSYDSRDRLTVIRYPDASEARYSYDANGNRTSVTAIDIEGNQHRTTYRYDAANRLLAVRDPDNRETLYEYDAADRITSVTYPNGMRTENSFTTAGLLEVMETKFNGTTIERLHYSFGESYQRSGVTKLDGRSTQFTYDAALRLTSETQLMSDQSIAFREAYSYDLAGNRRSVTKSNGDALLLTYNANNQVVSFGDRVYSYDGRGRLVLETGPNHRVEYSYDAEDQLVRVVHNGSVIEYVFDALGNRVAEIRNGTRINYLIDLRPDGIEQVLAEYPAGEPFSVTYVYGHQRISREQATGTEFFHYDASQNVVGLSNLAGAMTDHYVMTAFGEVLRHVGDSDNPYQFASERADSQSGLVHMRARDYLPSQGRFISRDPFEGLLTDSMSLHRYQYAHQNPVSNVDPTGEFTLTEQAQLGGLIGLVSSTVGGLLNGKHGSELAFEMFVGAAFGAIGGQLGGALAKAFAVEFMQAKIFTTIISNPVVIKYSPRLVYAIPNTVLSVGEDLTKGFGTGDYRDPGFAEGVAFNAGANFFFNVLVGPGMISRFEVQKAVPTGRRLGETGSATYQIFTRAAREKAAPHFKEMINFFGDGNFTPYQELFLTFLNDTTKFLASKVISIHMS